MRKNREERRCREAHPNGSNEDLHAIPLGDSSAEHPLASDLDQRGTRASGAATHTHRAAIPSGRGRSDPMCGDQRGGASRPPLSRPSTRWREWNARRSRQRRARREVRALPWG